MKSKGLWGRPGKMGIEGSGRRGWKIPRGGGPEGCTYSVPWPCWVEAGALRAAQAIRITQGFQSSSSLGPQRRVQKSKVGSVETAKSGFLTRDLCFGEVGSPLFVSFLDE